ncbi:MAG: branched-chain amino acid ABC transporter permease [Bacillota bacterium]|jgi:branched-chain amino acid transport system permease protein|nr:branched-chain amino acid ABC transporter permease [Candidatus Fermentithermobacillaceae bacterium]
MQLSMFFQHLANAISLGSLYSLVAIGYTMVYGILRLINFAHGDLLMLAAYIVYYGRGMFHLPWVPSILLAILLTAAIGIIVERSAYRPLRDSPRTTILISAIGVSFLVENLGLVLFGGRPQPFPLPVFFDSGSAQEIGGVRIENVTFAIPVVTLVLLYVLLHIVHRTKTGMAMRAVAKDFDTARLMGIDVNRIVATTFAIGSALAAVGGIMWGMKFPQINPLMGMMPGMKCFIAAVFGGIGNIQGAVIGGFILGVAEIMIVAFLPSISGYRDAFAFVILIGTLLLRPTGLIGEKVAEKV